MVVTLLCSASLHDVDIIAGDGVTLACHKCVLDARVQYFRGLFSSAWIEVVCSRWIVTIESVQCCYMSLCSLVAGKEHLINKQTVFLNMELVFHLLLILIKVG